MSEVIQATTMRFGLFVHSQTMMPAASAKCLRRHAVLMTSAAWGTASPKVARSSQSRARASRGCAAMYSSTVLVVVMLESPFAIAGVDDGHLSDALTETSRPRLQFRHQRGLACRRIDPKKIA